MLFDTSAKAESKHNANENYSKKGKKIKRADRVQPLKTYSWRKKDEDKEEREADQVKEWEELQHVGCSVQHYTFSVLVFLSYKYLHG